MSEVITTPEPEVKEEPKVDTPDIFDPNSIEFEDTYETHGYNTEKLEGYQKEELEGILGKYKELGFSQEQLEYVLNNKNSKEETKLNPREELQKHLSADEKRNYKAIANTVTSKLQGTELEKYTTDILSNPFLVKIFNQFTQAATPTITGKEINSKPTNNLGPVEALGKYNEFLMEKGSETTAEEKKNFINDLIKGSKSKAELEGIFKDILNYL